LAAAAAGAGGTCRGARRSRSREHADGADSRDESCSAGRQRRRQLTQPCFFRARCSVQSIEGGAAKIYAVLVLVLVVLLVLPLLLLLLVSVDGVLAGAAPVAGAVAAVFTLNLSNSSR
jgi:Flp pilus assembly protein TadB